MKNEICSKIGVSEKIYDFVIKAETELHETFKANDEIMEYCQFKVLSSMRDTKLSAVHFNGATGYGYGDMGRDKIEEIFSNIFCTEDSLVRTSIVSGTHAIFLGLSALLKHGDTLLSISGTPYDTIRRAIGISGNEKNSLIACGVKYDEADLIGDDFDIDLILEKVKKNPKLVMIQRSTGYSERNAISIEKMERVISFIRASGYEGIIFVDNCYGEFTEKKEPTEVGADIVCGSLIKNLGAGIAVSGGYICAKAPLISEIADRLTAPGLGKELGLSYGTSRSVLTGLFYAPQAVNSAKKTAVLFASCFRKLGFKVFPDENYKRSDIVESIVLGSPKALLEFCKGVQEMSAVDSFVTPEPWDMPGYSDKVVMASGSFIDGSSIEISADAPIREPYIVYFQGGLNFMQGKLALMKVLQNLCSSGIIKSEFF